MQMWDKYIRGGGLLIVLSGPSGVGKDAVLSELQQMRPRVRRCVTTTTRAIRANETDGVDYNFITVEEFRRRVDQGGFLEYAQVFGNLYGTPRQWVDEHLALGEDVVLKIDVQGGLSVKRQMPECVMVFLIPPSMEELERRLRSRLTESDAEATKRLLDARSELEQIPYYDYIVENNSLRTAAEELEAIIVAEHRRIQR